MSVSRYTSICRLLAALGALPPIITARVALLPPHVARQYDTTSSCHYLPGDADWPSLQQWQVLNQSVDGRLIAGVPLARICYGPEADEASCAALRNSWTNVTTYFNDPVEVMSPLFLNDSCTPFVEPGTMPDISACTLGNIPSYAINVSTAEDVVAGIQFVKDRNIRLVVKNTGHDFQGRSTGKGSLSLWTHNLKSISFLNYTSNGYTGPAVRIGAGVQAYEAYGAVAARGLRITGGLCPTVGIAGGYVTGGGHGPLMGRYGLAADNSLEFEVVTPEECGPFLGGGSAYAVILSQTTRVHADGPVAATTLTFTTTDDTKFWDAVDAWHVLLPTLNRVPGAACTFAISNDTMRMFIKVLDGTTTELDDTLAPFLAHLDELNVPYTNNVTYDPTFYSLIAKTASFPYGVYPTNDLAGGRLIPLSVVKSEDQRSELVVAIRAIVDSQTSSFTVAGNAADLSVSRTGLDNAVHPVWRSMAYSLIISVYTDPAASPDLLSRANAEVITGQDVLRRLTPGSGTYINEATLEPDYWKDDFYGPNYPKLLEVRNKYDPDVVLYGPAVVGSDYWTVVGDDRLCRQQG
ncbi:FAD binding domain-containing protein [Xylariales sp. AK1849]|nr:FAD binding domain-containing protein [Xylariales sp. AK1849]